MDWDEKYQRGEAFWDKGAPAPAMKQYLARQTVRGRTLVPGCGRGHEVALAVEHGLDATGLDIAPTGVAEARAKYPHLAERFVIGNLFDPPKEMRGVGIRIEDDVLVTERGHENLTAAVPKEVADMEAVCVR